MESGGTDGLGADPHGIVHKDKVWALRTSEPEALHLRNGESVRTQITAFGVSFGHLTLPP